MLRALCFLLIAASPLVLSQGVQNTQGPWGMDEQSLYQGEFPYSKYAAGYGAGPSGPQVERVDEQVQALPDVVENQPGQDTQTDFNFPETNFNNKFDLTKEIHSYNTQRRVVNRLDRNLRRYFKNLNVNSIYNTNIQRVRHAKLLNLLNVQTQDTHRPFLNVKFNRQDTTADLGARDEGQQVEQQQTMQVLQPIVEPVQVQRAGYDGQAMQAGLGLGGGSADAMQPMLMNRYYNQGGYNRGGYNMGFNGGYNQGYNMGYRHF